MLFQLYPNGFYLGSLTPPHNFSLPCLLLHLAGRLLLGPLSLDHSHHLGNIRQLVGRKQSAWSPQGLRTQLACVWGRLFLSWNWPWDSLDPVADSLARRLSSGGSPVALAEWEAPVLQGLGLVCTGMDALACLADWQKRRDSVEKLWWWEETVVEESAWRKSFTESGALFFSNALITHSSTCSHLTTAKSNSSLICWSVMNADYLNSLLYCRDSIDCLETHYIKSIWAAENTLLVWLVWRFQQEMMFSLLFNSFQSDWIEWLNVEI